MEWIRLLRNSLLVDSFHGFDFSKFRMPLITVYDNPLDFPNKYVARVFDLDQRTEYATVRDTLEGIRETIPLRFFCIGRQPEDDPVIVEVWI